MGHTESDGIVYMRIAGSEYTRLTLCGKTKMIVLKRGFSKLQSSSGSLDFHIFGCYIIGP